MLVDMNVTVGYDHTNYRKIAEEWQEYAAIYV